MDMFAAKRKGAAMLSDVAPWIVFALFCAVTLGVGPRRVSAPQFFDGRRDDHRVPGVLMVAMRAANTWVFAKSSANASALAYGYGLAGGIGYTVYYLSFVWGQLLCTAGFLLGAVLVPAQRTVRAGQAEPA